MRTFHYCYPVQLSEEQRRWLSMMAHTSSTPAKHYLVAHVLLMSDQRQGAPEATDGQIAEALSISRRTVIRIKQRFVQKNLEVALTGSFPRERPERQKYGSGCARTMSKVTHSPAEVIGWYKGTLVPPETLNRILFATRYTRQLDRNGYIRFQDWRLYGERGLAYQPVNVWVYEGTLKLEHQAVTFFKYHVELHEDRRHIKEVGNPRIAETIFCSPQMMLFDLGPDEWLLYWKSPSYAPRKPRRLGPKITQLVLFEGPAEMKAVGAETAHPSLHLIISPKSDALD